MQVLLRFSHNNSIYVDRVLAIAGGGAVERLDDRDGIHYTLTFDQGHLADFFLALDYARNWESTTIEVNGQRLLPKQLREVTACYRARQKADDPMEFCQCSSKHGLFPCRAIIVDESDEHGWFRYGRLEDGTLTVDKGKIERLIRAQLARQHFDLCPFLRQSDLSTILVELPTTIDPEKDTGWEFRQEWVKGRLARVGVQKAKPGGSPIPPRPEDETVNQDGSRRHVPDVTYAEIGGLKAQLQLVRETIELPLRHPEVFRHLGITPNRGVLLWGPPGTGKTLIAKAVANQCQAHLTIVRGPEVKSKWHGQSESNLRDIFDEARTNEPAIILFDEIDALVPNRATLSHDVNISMVSQLLTLMDGIEERGHVLIIGTTNRPEAIDSAFRRPGRFDLEIEIGLPDATAIREILAIHTGKMPLAPDVDLERLVPHLCGLTGADVAALCKEAGLVCLRERISFDHDDLVLTGELEGLVVNARHFEQALQNMLHGLAKRRDEPGKPVIHAIKTNRG